MVQEETVGPGSVMITGAGIGLGYEERNTGSKPAVFIQLWIEPKLQNAPPRHQFKYIANSNEGYGLTTLVWNGEGDKHCWINQNCKVSLGRYDAGDHLQYNFEPYNKCIYLFVVRGELHVEHHHLHEKDAVGLWGSDKVSILMLQDSWFILIEVPINH